MNAADIVNRKTIEPMSYVGRQTRHVESARQDERRVVLLDTRRDKVGDRTVSQRPIELVKRERSIMNDDQIDELRHARERHVRIARRHLVHDATQRLALRLVLRDAKRYV
jgi:hypothetical protein